LGLAGGADADADHVAPAIQVDTDRLADFSADGGKPLGKLRCHQRTHGEALVVELLELFELVGLESFERSKNFLDGGASGEGVIAYFEGSGGRMTTAGLD
jgi:hypothetical protein